MLSDGPPGFQVGNGTKIASVSPRGFEQGKIQSTGRDTDVAINGKGFFAVALPDGTVQYTRDGSLSKDATGRLVTATGNIVQPPITVPTDTLTMSIGSDGTVSVLTASSPNTPKVLGQIHLASFPNQEGLLSVGNNLWSETVASGPPALGAPGSGVLGTLQQANLELSNVDVSTELTNLVTTQQAYSANSKIVTTTNQMVVSALSLIT